MPATLTIHDETASGTILYEFPLEFSQARITVRDLIRERVYQEVQDYNLHGRTREGPFRGLVQPKDAELTLNGFKLRQDREIDWKQQFDKAIEAFARNGFVLLIDDRQAESLDEEVLIQEGTQVSFVKLVPLVGG
jgi:hypothetical protein